MVFQRCSIELVVGWKAVGADNGLQPETLADDRLQRPPLKVTQHGCADEATLLEEHTLRPFKLLIHARWYLHRS